jgi:hypothetical protein
MNSPVKNSDKDLLRSRRRTAASFAKEKRGRPPAALFFAVAFFAMHATAQPAAPASKAVVTYQCHSTQKSRDIFMRFDADGSWEAGVSAKDLKPTGHIIIFDKSGVATWTTKSGSANETNTFDKNTGQWVWDSGMQLEAPTRYACKPI